jgi:hypothetical protein
MVNRRLVMIVVPLAVVVSGCSSSTNGSPGPTSSATSAPSTSRTVAPTTASDGALASIDPCSLLDPAIVAQSGMHLTGYETSLGARSCSWDQDATATNNGGFSIAINIYDHAGLDQLSTVGFTITNFPVGRHQGRLNQTTANGNLCAVSIGVTATSRVDVQGVAGDGRQAVSCQLAETAAPSVEQKLPVGG